jgi:hypothetical protein
LKEGLLSKFDFVKIVLLLFFCSFHAILPSPLGARDGLDILYL